METATPASRLMTRANALTGVRLIAVPFLVHAVLEGRSTLALGLFVLAIATDWLDGRVARRYGEVTPFGGLLDHSTDALLVSSGLAAVATSGEVTWWLPPLILLAFLQYAIDSRAPQGKPLRASSLGRWNGIAYFVLLGIPVVRDGLGLGFPPVAWTGVAAWLLVATTSISILDRGSSSAQIRKS